MYILKVVLVLECGNTGRSNLFFFSALTLKGSQFVPS